jgi:hypothetical protein
LCCVGTKKNSKQKKNKNKKPTPNSMPSFSPLKLRLSLVRTPPTTFDFPVDPKQEQKEIREFTVLVSTDPEGEKFEPLTLTVVEVFLAKNLKRFRLRATQVSKPAKPNKGDNVMVVNNTGGISVNSQFGHASITTSHGRVTKSYEQFEPSSEDYYNTLMYLPATKLSMSHPPVSEKGKEVMEALEEIRNRIIEQFRTEMGDHVNNGDVIVLGLDKSTGLASFENFEGFWAPLFDDSDIFSLPVTIKPTNSLRVLKDNKRWLFNFLKHWDEFCEPGPWSATVVLKSVVFNPYAKQPFSLKFELKTGTQPIYWGPRTQIVEEDEDSMNEEDRKVFERLKKQSTRTPESEKTRSDTVIHCGNSFKRRSPEGSPTRTSKQKPDTPQVSNMNPDPSKGF